MQAGRKDIWLQLDAQGFVKEGVEQLLDNVRQRASVNGLLLDTFWYSSAEGGYMGALHAPYYKDAGIPISSLWQPKGKDILAALAEPARERGMTRTSIIKDMLPEKIAGAAKLCERDFNGAVAETTCKNNPYYRNLVLGLVEDAIRSYDVDGVLYMAERQGPFTDTLGMRFRGKQRGLPGSRTCFCEFCRAKGEKLGLRFDRVQAAYEALARFTAAGRARRRPPDGYYSNLWRLMLRHPELLAWEHLWHESFRELLQLLHAKVKAVRPAVRFGSHIWPNHSMNPIFRAEQDLAAMAPYHDFIKFPLYYNCGGTRMASYIESVGETIWGDVPPDELLQFHYRVLDYDEAPYGELRQAGLYRSYVYRECKRAMAGVRGTAVELLPGIEIDIPVLRADLAGAPAGLARCTRAGVRDMVKQAFRAAVPGIIISREYTEMRPENLSGVGDAVRELGLRT
ncbi:MAG: hypothetical protein ACE15B_04495 [Bryobacteraceae bacterium]